MQETDEPNLSENYTNLPLSYFAVVCMMLGWDHHCVLQHQMSHLLVQHQSLHLTDQLCGKKGIDVSEKVFL